MEALKMESKMGNWNDDRLDELGRTTKEDFAEVKAEMKEGFAKVDRRLESLDDKFDRKFDRIQYTLLALVIALIGHAVF